MSKTCTICAHPQRAEIDAALLAHSQPRSKLSAAFRVSQDALDRHAHNHLPVILAQAQAAAEVARADTLLDQLRDLQRRTLAALEKAERDGDLRITAMLLREARGCLTLLARLTGELDSKRHAAPGDAAQSLANNPEWILVRRAIVDALAPYPEARTAIVEAMHHVGVYSGDVTSGPPTSSSEHGTDTRREPSSDRPWGTDLAPISAPPVLGSWPAPVQPAAGRDRAPQTERTATQDRCREGAALTVGQRPANPSQQSPDAFVAGSTQPADDGPRPEPLFPLGDLSAPDPSQDRRPPPAAEPRATRPDYPPRRQIISRR